MQDKLREIARKFIESDDAACFIGWEAAPQGGTRPLFVRSAADADRFVWNDQCHANLARYLGDFKNTKGKVGVALKGCDARALRELVRANQVDRSKVFAVGVPCKGMSAPGGGIAERSSTEFPHPTLPSRCGDPLSMKSAAMFTKRMAKPRAATPTVNLRVNERLFWDMMYLLL